MKRYEQGLTAVNSLHEAWPHHAAIRSSIEDLCLADHCQMTFPTPCSHPAPCGMPCRLNLGPERHAVLELGSLARLAVMAVPGSRGSFREQAEELFAQLLCIVSRQAA